MINLYAESLIYIETFSLADQMETKSAKFMLELVQLDRLARAQGQRSSTAPAVQRGQFKTTFSITRNKKRLIFFSLGRP